MSKVKMSDEEMKTRFRMRIFAIDVNKILI